MLIKNGRIHVGDGQVLENQDILINNGIIEKIEPSIDYEDTEVIDAEGKEVFPGFIDPVSSYGCIDISYSVKDNDEISKPINPELKIKYSFNHGEIMVEELYKVGITAIGAAPGNKNIIGGQMAVYKTWGQNSLKMLVKEPVGLKGSVIKPVKETYGERKILPMTKMGIFNELDSFLAEYKEKLPLFITANTATEINALLNITSKYDIELIICGGYQADRCMEYIKEANASIILGEQTELTAKNYNNTDLYKIAQLQREGGLVSFTLTADYGPEGKMKYLWNAIEFYKSGVDSEEVLKMMTINPAKMLGVDNRLGTIEEGKEADIVIYSNNPIEYYNSKVLYTIIGGNVAYREGRMDRCC